MWSLIKNMEKDKSEAHNCSCYMRTASTWKIEAPTLCSCRQYSRRSGNGLIRYSKVDTYIPSMTLWNRPKHITEKWHQINFCGFYIISIIKGLLKKWGKYWILKLNLEVVVSNHLQKYTIIRPDSKITTPARSTDKYFSPHPHHRWKCPISRN